MHGTITTPQVRYTRFRCRFRSVGIPSDLVKRKSEKHAKVRNRMVALVK